MVWGGTMTMRQHAVHVLIALTIVALTVLAALALWAALPEAGVPAAPDNRAASVSPTATPALLIGPSPEAGPRLF